MKKSCEPLLGPVDLSKWLPEHDDACPKCGGEVGCNGDGSWKCIADRGHLIGCGWSGKEAACACDGKPGIGWAIVGGESGHGDRPCRVEWIRDIVRQCRDAGVPVFVKQLGSFIVDRNDRGFDATAETWADGPDEGKPTDPEAWPDMPDLEEDLDGTRDGYQGAPVRVRLVDRKGGDMAEWPADLQVREFPVVKAGVA